MAETLEQQSDESLMERIKKRDHQAFSVLVIRRNEMFYAAAYRMMMNKEEAEDIAQEAFLKLWDRPEIWKSNKGAKFTTWFYRLVMNICIDKLRKKSKSVLVDITDTIKDEGQTQEQEMIGDEQQQALDLALKSLPAKQLMALNLCFYEGMSNKEAAEIMGVRLKALESLLMRAKSGLKDYLYRENILQRREAV